VSEDKLEKQPVAAIKGTHDILPKEARDWQRVEAAAKAVFELYGYREIRTPVFEATELFEKGTGQTTDIVQKEMYTFTDKGGRSITLRPEYTPSVARAIIEHRLDLLPDPMRYYFIGPMFRFDKPQKGRFRQFHQVDVEVFGECDAAIDAELIEMAVRLLGKLKVTDTEVLVNSVGCRKCRPAYLKDLHAAAAAVMPALCADCQRKAETNPLRIFDCKVEACREIALGFPEITGYLDAECAEHFRKFRSCLELYGIAYRVEPRLVRGIDYYTRTTFEITTTRLGAQNSLLGGGRYDDMMKDFGGPDMCATGFAMGVERLISVAGLDPVGEDFVYLAYLGDSAKNEAIGLARFLRSNGVQCLLEFKDKGLKSQLSRASKLGASWALIIGEEEIRKGRYQVKDLKTGTQTEADKDGILRTIGQSDK
jgi:histidyl-tRNA synthetase